jgi:hypothetical protein
VDFGYKPIIAIIFTLHQQILEKLRPKSIVGPGIKPEFFIAIS